LRPGVVPCGCVCARARAARAARGAPHGAWVGEAVPGRRAVRGRRDPAAACVGVAASGASVIEGLAAAMAEAQPVAGAMFGGVSVYVLPFYALMILRPRWEPTRRLMQSYLPFIPMAGLYLYMLMRSWTPDTLQLMLPGDLALAAQGPQFFPRLDCIAVLFSRTWTVASAWVHLLCVDLFMARHIFLECLRDDLPTLHTLVLCMLFGPGGMLCHVATRAVVLAARGRFQPPGAPAPAPPEPLCYPATTP